MGFLLSLGVLDMAETTRLTALFSGSVQGVGFRFTTQNIASGLPLTGYVKNLRDGRVELVAEGERNAIDDLLSEVHSELGRGIDHEDTAWEKASGEFQGFTILY